MDKEEEDKELVEDNHAGDDGGSEAGWSDCENRSNDDSYESDGDESVSGASAGGDGSGISSDESDGGSEKCAICLQRFLGQEIGSPETCEHHFCLKCITEWSKKVATCPVDRKTFPAILVKKELFGQVIRIVDVEVENVGSTSLLDDYDTDPTYCEVCGHCDREDRLLLCDGCDLGFHLECLEPPLEYVPIEDWFCPACQTERLASEEAARRPSRRQLRLPRTGQTRRIIEGIRQSVRRGNPNQLEGDSQPATTTRRRTTTPRASSRRSKKRKTTKGTGRRSKRKTRKGRKRNRVAIQRRPVTARGRLAVQLGILPPRPGQVYVGLPRCRTPVSQATQSSNSSSSLRNLRYQAGITPLRIYSTSEDLADCMESFSDEEGPVGVARAQPIHRIGFPVKPGLSSSRSRALEIPQPSSSSDILGTILSNQIIMLTDRNMKIKRDGTLVPSISVKPPPLSPLQPSRRNSVTNENSVCDHNDKSHPVKGYSPAPHTSLTPSLTQTEPAGRQVPTSPAATANENNSSTNFNSGSNSRSSEGQSSQHRETDGGSASSGSVTNSWASNNSGSGSWYLQNSVPFTPRGDDPNGAKAYESYLYSSSVPSKNNQERRKSSDDTENNNGDEDEEYNIYSDIEEDAVADEGRQVDGNEAESEPSGLKDKDKEQDSDEDMVIAEDDVGRIKPIQRDSRSSAESSSRADHRDDGRSSAEPDARSDLAFGLNNMPSPASIPLPDSPPPSGTTAVADDDVDDEDDAESEVSLPDYQDSRKNGHKSHGRAVEEYDPSQPLTSSDEEEHSIQLTQGSTQRRSPHKSQATQPAVTKPAKGLPKKQGRERGEEPASDVDLSSIPLPSDDHGKPHDDHRVRPTIQFSIPTRHKLLSISSLIKRQKGVAKKETKNALSFSSEVSKAFGEDKQDDSDDESGKADEPKVSLVAEIFGSDDEEEKSNDAEADNAATGAADSATKSTSDIVLMPGRIPLLPPAPNPVPPVTIPIAPEPEDQVQAASVAPPVPPAEQSNRWKKIVEDDALAEESLSQAEKAADDQPSKIADVDEGSNDSIAVLETVQKAKTADDDEIQVLGVTHAKERRVKEAPKKPPQPESEKDKGSQLESISEGDSEFERQSRRGDGSAGESKRKSRRDRAKLKDNKEKDKERKSSKRRRSHSSASNREEGEIIDSPEKRRKKRKEKKKAKKRKRSKSGKSGIDFSEKKISDVSTSIRHSSEEENMGDSVISWRKPSNSAKERNYRDGKPKPEEKYFKPRDKKRDSSPRGDHHEKRDKSPAVGKDKSFRERNDSGRSRRRSMTPRSRSRSLSRSRPGRRVRSRSDRSSSSNRSLRSRSRSPSFRRRKRGKYSLSPRRSRSFSRSPLKPHSRSPLRRRSRNRKRSSSPGRPRRLKGRKRSGSVSSSVSSKRYKRKRKEREIAGDKVKKKREKEKERAPEPRDLKEKEKEREKEREREKDKEKKKRKKRKEKSVSPAKEIFADGDSIVVSLNFQKGTTSTPSGSSAKDTTSSSKNNDSDSERRKARGGARRGRSSEKDGSGKPRLLKKTLLIDLETSPVQEQNIGVSPTLIVLSDDEEKGQEGRKDAESKDNLPDGSTVTTSSTDGQKETNSPYRHGVVAADSTQIHHPNQSDAKTDNSSFGGSLGASTPPYDNNDLSPSTRDDSMVTSTRDAEIGLPPEDDSTSPTSSPVSKPCETLHQPHSPAGSPPPLPPDSPPRHHDSRNENCGTPTSSVSSHLSSQTPLGGSGKPLIGNIPGLFSSSSGVGPTGGPVCVPPPVLIPTPPAPQMRIPTSVNQSLLAPMPTMLASVATALFVARQQQQQHQTAPSGKFSTPPGSGNAPNKVTPQGSVLLPKSQNSHSSSSRSKGNGSGILGGEGDSPFSPNSSDGDDLFEPPLERGQTDNGPSKSDKSLSTQSSSNAASNSAGGTNSAPSGSKRDKISDRFDLLFGPGGPPPKKSSGHHKSHDKPGKLKPTSAHKSKSKRGAKKEVPKMSEGELRSTDEVPNSAVELRNKEKFLKKLNRQERVVEEVKLSLKPHYTKKHVTKDEYKEILRRAVPKICHNKSGEINPYKIKELVEAYVKKFRHSRKKEGGAAGGGGGGVNIGSS